MSERLVLLPRDGFFFKDGRGWQSSFAGRGRSLEWPFPSTVLGALRTAWGRQVEQQEHRHLDPETWPVRTAGLSLRTMLALRRGFNKAWSPAHRMWPAPADSLYVEGETHATRLDPRPSDVRTIGTREATEGARERLWWPSLDRQAKPETGPRWWTEGDFINWLVGEPVAKVSREDHEVLSLPDRDQFHVRIDPASDTAFEGFLYSTRVCESLVRQRERRAWMEWAIGVDCDMPSAGTLAGSKVVLGGKGKLATVTSAAPALFGRPERLDQAFATHPSGLRLVIVTPALFDAGWCPEGFNPTETGYAGKLPGMSDDLRLVAALVPRPQHLSGWDMARGRPKDTDRLVPTGSVYFFVKRNGRPFEPADAEGLWLAQLGDRTREGFGCVVPGTWHPAANATRAEIRP